MTPSIGDRITRCRPLTISEGSCMNTNARREIFRRLYSLVEYGPISRDALKGAIDLSDHDIAIWKAGATSGIGHLPSMETLVDLCEVCDVEANWLLAMTEEDDLDLERLVEANIRGSVQQTSNFQKKKSLSLSTLRRVP
jgi:hypothetical protein